MERASSARDVEVADRRLLDEVAADERQLVLERRGEARQREETACWNETHDKDGDER